MENTNKTIKASARCLCDFAVFVPERNSGVPDVHRLLQRGGPAQRPDGDGQLRPEHDPGGVPVHEGVPTCAQWTTQPLCECVCWEVGVLSVLSGQLSHSVNGGVGGAVFAQWMSRPQTCSPVRFGLSNYAACVRGEWGEGGRGDPVCAQ